MDTYYQELFLIGFSKGVTIAKIPEAGTLSQKLFQIDFPNHMILNIGHIQHIFMQRHSLRVVERRCIKSTILTSNGPGTNNVLYACL